MIVHNRCSQFSVDWFTFAITLLSFHFAPNCCSKNCFKKCFRSEKVNICINCLICAPWVIIYVIQCMYCCICLPMQVLPNSCPMFYNCTLYVLFCFSPRECAVGTVRGQGEIWRGHNCQVSVPRCNIVIGSRVIVFRAACMLVIAPWWVWYTIMNKHNQSHLRIDWESPFTLGITRNVSMTQTFCCRHPDKGKSVCPTKGVGA